MAFSVTYTDPTQLSDRQLLFLILERFTTMSQVATDTAAAVAALDAKVDTLISVVTPALANLQAQLTAAQDLAASLQAQLVAAQSDAAADAAVLTTTIADAQNEAVKVQAAIDALNPPPVQP